MNSRPRSRSGLGDELLTQRALVAYSSSYGNTQRVAAAIGDGLRGAGPVSVVPLAELPSLASDCDALVVGAPTHRRRAPADWAASLHREQLPSRATVAVFDTRYRRPRWLTGSAAGHLTRLLAGAGLNVVDRQSFFVEDREGPLLEGELQRAQEWGEELARRYLK